MSTETARLNVARDSDVDLARPSSEALDLCHQTNQVSGIAEAISAGVIMRDFLKLKGFF